MMMIEGMDGDDYNSESGSESESLCRSDNGPEMLPIARPREWSIRRTMIEYCYCLCHRPGHCFCHWSCPD
jgi:hypothetical protein